MTKQNIGDIKPVNNNIAGTYCHSCVWYSAMSPHHNLLKKRTLIISILEVRKWKLRDANCPKDSPHLMQLPNGKDNIWIEELCLSIHCAVLLWTLFDLF